MATLTPAEQAKLKELLAKKNAPPMAEKPPAGEPPMDGEQPPMDMASEGEDAAMAEDTTDMPSTPDADEYGGVSPETFNARAKQSDMAATAARRGTIRSGWQKAAEKVRGA